MNRKMLVACVLLSACGCASYTKAKIDLTTQAQAGVKLVRTELDAQRDRDAAASDALRARLDEAFDADVQSRVGSADGALDPEWVIAHRKAYAAAVDAFDLDRRSAERESQATLRTLDAIDAALAQLQQMHASELKLSLPEIDVQQLKPPHAEVK